MSEQQTIGRPRRMRRASYLVFVALFIVVLLGFTAYTVDVAVLHLAHQQLRHGVDSAALAGASHLDGTPEGLEQARASAIATGGANSVRGMPIALDDAALTFGHWDHEAGVFSPGGGIERMNALQVQRTVANVPTPFAGAAFGLASTDVDASSVAVRPLPEPISRAECFLPIAVPSCQLAGIEGGPVGVLQLQLANDAADNAAWAHPDGANASNIRSALEDAASGECEGAYPVVAEGDDLPVTNGVESSSLHELRRLLRMSDAAWEDDLWGAKPPRDPDSSLTDVQYPTNGVIQGPIPVVDDGGGMCSAIKFNQSMPVERLAWGVIFDVYQGPGQHKGVQMLIDFEHDFESPGTQPGSGNVLARPPGRLVR